MKNERKMKESTYKKINRILVIGDTHGRDDYKIPLEYFRPDEIDTNIHLYDYIVFMGDYVDSFDVGNKQMRNVLLDIINLKKKYPKKVVLLLGNHDLQYIFVSNDFRCSGYRPEMKYDFFDIFNINKSLFQVAFEIETTEKHKYIFTHAGIHRGFYNNYLKEHDTEKTLADTLNFLYPNYKPLFHVSWFRGGFKKEGGVFWADKQEIYKKPLKGYHQIIWSKTL